MPVCKKIGTYNPQWKVLDDSTSMEQIERLTDPWIVFYDRHCIVRGSQEIGSRLWRPFGIPLRLTGNVEFRRRHPRLINYHGQLYNAGGTVQCAVMISCDIVRFGE